MVRELAETIRLRDDAQASRGDGRWLVVRRGYQLRLPPLPPTSDKLVDEILHVGVASDVLVGRSGQPETADVVRVLGVLRAGGWLQRCLVLDGQPLITIRPVVKPQRIVRRVLTRAAVVRLSRFSYLRGDESGYLRLTAPTAHEQVVIHDPRFLCLLQTLVAPLTMAEVQREHGALFGERTLGHLLLTLLGLGLLVEVPTSGPAADEAGSLAAWDFEELLLHTYSREGRADTLHGATYRKAKAALATPARAPVTAPVPSRAVELPPPPAGRSGVALQRVLEARRSTRDYAEDQPIELPSLSAFLREACGAVAWRSGERRPYPSAGGLYELQVYPVVRRCEQLDPAVYRYDPHAHRLDLVAPYDAKVEALLRDARYGAAMGSDPQVLLVITARFALVMHKYDAIAYSLVLKDVGVLFQTMYLVATQLRLGCCAVGNGNSDLFAEICGHDFYEESSVGEFVLGRPATPTKPIHTRRFSHV